MQTSVQTSVETSTETSVGGNVETPVESLDGTTTVEGTMANGTTTAVMVVGHDLTAPTATALAKEARRAIVHATRAEARDNAVCHFYSATLPSEGTLVIATVATITDMGVHCVLPEYGGRSFSHTPTLAYT